jgi:hypothetical protein
MLSSRIAGQSLCLNLVGQDNPHTDPHEFAHAGQSLCLNLMGQDDPQTWAGTERLTRILRSILLPNLYAAS